MTRALLTLCILWASAAGMSAQELTRFFELVPPKHKNKISGSLYNSIDFLDSRNDSALIGRANVGLLKNRAARLVLKTPVLPQLRRLLDSLTDPTATTGELLFQLRDFSFAETMGARYCYLTANLYAKADGGYKRVSSLDDQAKKIKLKSKNIYAVVYQGKPFIATEYGFYPLEKVSDNFFFTGDVRIAATNGEVNGGQFAMGLIGAWAASKGTQETFDMIIDHQNGNFIHLRFIPKPDAPF